MNLAALVANPRVLITPFGLHPAEFVVIVFIIFIIFIIVRRRVKVKL